MGVFEINMGVLKIPRGGIKHTMRIMKSVTFVRPNIFARVTMLIQNSSVPDDPRDPQRKKKKGS